MGRERASRPAVRRIDTLALIAGAGAAGIQLLEEIESRRRLRFGIVGFVDDDPGKLGMRICGTPVSRRRSAFGRSGSGATTRTFRSARASPSGAPVRSRQRRGES